MKARIFDGARCDDLRLHGMLNDGMLIDGMPIDGMPFDGLRARSSQLPKRQSRCRRLWNRRPRFAILARP
jgi:hypothetical protein